MMHITSIFLQEFYDFILCSHLMLVHTIVKQDLNVSSFCLHTKFHVNNFLPLKYLVYLTQFSCFVQYSFFVFFLKIGGPFL